MTISYINSRTTASASATSLTPLEPVGTVEDDFILAVCVKEGDAGTWTDPDDFIEIDQNPIAMAATGNTYIGYKKRAATQGSGYTFSHSDVAVTMRVTLAIYRGVSQVSPLDMAYARASHYIENLNDGGLAAANAITTTTANAWVLLIQDEMPDGAFTAGSPVGYILDVDLQTSDRVTQIAHKEIASPTTETPGVWTHTNVSATADSVDYTIALRDAAVDSVSPRGRMLMTGIG